MDDFELTSPPDKASYDARRAKLERRAREIEGDGVLFNQASWDLVLDLIEDGFTTLEIDENPDLPSWSTIRRWMRADQARRDQYRAARELSGDAFEAQLIGIGQNTFDKDDVPAARLRADILKWTMARRAPRVYGDQKNIVDNEPVVQEKMEIEGGLPEMPLSDDDAENNPPNASSGASSGV